MTAPLVVYQPNLHPGQLRIRKAMKESGSRFGVVMCGRRWGKTTDGVDWLMDGAIDGESTAWFAPTYKLLGEAWRELVGRLRSITTRVSEQEKRIELLGGGIVECWSLDTPDPARGRKYSRIVIDEAGIVRDLQAVWDAAIRPTLVDKVGHARLYGTPKGRRHGFVKMFARGEALSDGWQSFRAPTSENPYIPQAEIEAARRELPAGVFAQEFEGVPADDGANPFGLTAIANATMTPAELEFVTRMREPAVWGWDFARAQDYTVGVGLDYDGKVCRLERWQGRPWQETAQRVADLSGRKPTVGDSTGIGDAVVEMIQRLGCRMWGLPFTQPSKQKLMERLATAIHSGQVKIPEGWLRSELEQFEFEYTAGGVKYSAPEGLHDDGVMALALAVYAKDRAGIHPPGLAEQSPYEAPHHDPHVVLRTRDGKPPVWIGPEGDNNEAWSGGYANQLPANI